MIWLPVCPVTDLSSSFQDMSNDDFPNWEGYGGSHIEYFQENLWNALNFGRIWLNKSPTKLRKSCSMLSMTEIILIDYDLRTDSNVIIDLWLMNLVHFRSSTRKIELVIDRVCSNVEMGIDLCFLSLLSIFMSLCESGTDSCGLRGVQSAIHDDVGIVTWNDVSEAYVEYRGTLLTPYYYLGLKGSFIANITGTHYFRLNQGIESPSVGIPPVDFAIEGNTIRASSSSYDRQLSLTTEFRYSFQMYRADEKKNSWMELIIVFPNGSSRRLDSEYGETCDTSGCRDTGLSRTPYNCLPSPSRSKSPSPTRSESPSPTQSHSPSPSPTQSISLHPSSAQSQSTLPTLSETPEFTPSELFTLHNQSRYGHSFSSFVQYGIFVMILETM
jgi:hypothetical protein